MVIESIQQHFSGLPDPRCRRRRRHRLEESAIIAILAVICCTDNWREVAQFAWAKRKRLKTFLELPHGIPSHDAFGRVFAPAGPEVFERCFLAWIQALAKVRPGELIAIDGKTLRRSFNRASGKAAAYKIKHANILLAARPRSSPANGGGLGTGDGCFARGPLCPGREGHRDL
jgi:hypothetical protein